MNIISCIQTFANLFCWFIFGNFHYKIGNFVYSKISEVFGFQILPSSAFKFPKLERTKKIDRKTSL